MSGSKRASVHYKYVPLECIFLLLLVRCRSLLILLIDWLVGWFDGI